MKVALVVSGGVPNPSASGGAVTSWSVLSHLLSEGHGVGVVALRDPEQYDPTATSEEARVAAVEALGAHVTQLVSRSTEFFRSRPRTAPARIARAWRPSDEELYPHLVDRDLVEGAIDSIGPDVVFAYHFEALAATASVRVPRLAIVGDPPHLSALYRFRDLLPDPRAFRRVVRLQSQVRHQPRVLVRLLNECAASGAFAAHHAAWLRSRGARGCEYYRTPIPDPGPPPERTSAARPIVLLVGHLKGIVTLNGMRIFAHEVLPRLEAALGDESFEARVLGGYDPPEELAEALGRPSVRLLGHVEDPREEFERASVLLVPNSIPLGVRVRILTGFAHGNCVVTHIANTQGIPELAQEQNCLVARSGAELADAVLHVLGDDELRARLGAGARATYERFFALPVAAGRIADSLERIAGPRKLATAAP